MAVSSSGTELSWALTSYPFLDISVNNILVPLDTSKLMGSCTDRAATLVDWDLCFAADGRASSRSLKSGTPIFMSPRLLYDEPLTRRTLAHDAESFFAVTIWIASYVFRNEKEFRQKPLAADEVIHATPYEKGQIKWTWFSDPKRFASEIIEHLERPFRQDLEFCALLLDLRALLYPRASMSEIKEKILRGETVRANEEEDGDMKEDVVRRYMQLIDEYLKNDEGCRELSAIDERAAGQSVE
jgi:hypothetical protein